MYVCYGALTRSGRASLCFTRNIAVNGGLKCLPRDQKINAKLLVLKEGSNRDIVSDTIASIHFMGNQAKECGGAVYAVDETNAATCEGTSSFCQSRKSHNIIIIIIHRVHTFFFCASILLQMG